MSDDAIDNIGHLAGGVDPKAVLGLPGVRAIDDGGYHDPDSEAEFWGRLRKRTGDDAAAKVRDLIIESAAEELLGVLFPEIFKPNEQEGPNPEPWPVIHGKNPPDFGIGPDDGIPPEEDTFPGIPPPPLEQLFKNPAFNEWFKKMREEAGFQYTFGDLCQFCDAVIRRLDCDPLPVAVQHLREQMGQEGSPEENLAHLVDIAVGRLRSHVAPASPKPSEATPVAPAGDADCAVPPDA